VSACYVLPLRTAWHIALGLATVSFLLKCTIAWWTYGTNDVRYWETFTKTRAEAGGMELYYRVHIFNHPPFMIHWLEFLDLLKVLTGLSFPFLLRMPAILADFGSVILVGRLLGPRLRQATVRRAWYLLAAAPPSFLISGFHGNTDSMMVFFVLLCIWLLVERYPAWLAGLAWGMSMNIKVVPILLAPVLFLWLPGWKKKPLFFLAAGGFWLFASLPFIARDPFFILYRFFTYGSGYGHWGLSRLTAWMPGEYRWVDWLFEDWGKYVMFGFIGLVAVVMNRRPAKPALFDQCGVAFLLFLVLTPGFGVQYLAWGVPWAPTVGMGATSAFYAGSFLFPLFVYIYWSIEYPLYLATADRMGDWAPIDILQCLEFACWLTAVYLLVLLVRQTLRRSSAVSTTEVSPGSLSTAQPQRGPGTAAPDATV